MKFSVTVTLKKDVLDPQGKVVKSIRQGKLFEIDIDDKNDTKALKSIDEMCKKLLVNLIIEDYKINKL